MHDSCIDTALARASSPIGTVYQTQKPPSPSRSCLCPWCKMLLRDTHNLLSMPPVCVRVVNAIGICQCVRCRHEEEAVATPPPVPPRKGKPGGRAGAASDALQAHMAAIDDGVNSFRPGRQIASNKELEAGTLNSRAHITRTEDDEDSVSFSSCMISNNRHMPVCACACACVCVRQRRWRWRPRIQEMAR